jgi:DNA mismatch endonuclease (patch repair protein)
MSDLLTKAKRSEVMSRIRGKDTQPELTVRRFLHAAGYRYRLYVSSLPGKPDIVLPRYHVCVFVHGCFWHGCPKCADGRRKPQSNRRYWLPKIRRNKRRDLSHVKNLSATGWNVLTIWECEIADRRKLEQLRRAILKASGRVSVKKAKAHNGQ